MRTVPWSAGARDPEVGILEETALPGFPARFGRSASVGRRRDRSLVERTADTELAAPAEGSGSVADLRPALPVVLNTRPFDEATSVGAATVDIELLNSHAPGWARPADASPGSA